MIRRTLLALGALAPIAPRALMAPKPAVLTGLAAWLPPVGAVPFWGLGDRTPKALPPLPSYEAMKATMDAAMRHLMARAQAEHWR